MPALSAEAVKQVVREYAESLYGDRWNGASVLVNLSGFQPEVLVVLRDGSSAGPSATAEICGG